MKKQSIVLFIALLASTAYLLSSCMNCIEGNGKMTSKEVKIGEITRIRLAADADVILVSDSGGTGSLKIDGESNIIEAFEFNVTGSTLRIRTEPCIRHHEPVTITIPVKTVDALTINGSGNFKANTMLHATDLELVVNGSGNIELQVEATNLENQVNGSGSILLKGSAQRQKTVINGSGSLESADFAAGKVHVTINGSGDCKVWATTSLSVNVRGSGNVYYKGAPDISTNIKGSGAVEKLQ